MSEMLELDGSQGEGGGQILRTALSLSMITGIPFRIDHIRAGRAKPGLLRQHLTAVEGAMAICGAKVSGAAPGSRSLVFTPGPVRGGEHRFAIGTAGSCSLVLQTLLPALWFADGEASLAITGGTHNPASPPADFLIRAWAPLLRRMGVEMEIELVRHGFYPAGGGEIRARLAPATKLEPLELDGPGEWLSTTAIAVVAAVPVEVAKRELARVAAQLGPVDEELRVLPANEGPGNALLVELSHDGLTELFTAFGARGLPAEKVADQAARQTRLFRDSGAAVGEHLADQIVLPLALAGGGGFTTPRLSSHLKTNMAVIEKFLPVEFEIAEEGSLARVAVAGEATMAARTA